MKRYWFRSLSLHITEKNLGVAKTRNRGGRLACGKYIAFESQRG